MGHTQGKKMEGTLITEQGYVWFIYKKKITLHVALWNDNLLDPPPLGMSVIYTMLYFSY